MARRIAFGLTTLLVVASCVEAPVDNRVVLAVPAAGKLPADLAARYTPKPSPGPAGPSAALLAHAPKPSIDDAVQVSAAPPFDDSGAAAVSVQRALNCLTAAVYYEARSESEEGQQAVAQVVLNRVRNPAFPNSVCGTVYEGASRNTGCQFSFTCDGSMRARREPDAWDRARKVAQAALDGFVFSPVGASTYYHTTAVNPWWSSKVTQVATLGAHIFYRLPGAWGGKLAFQQAYSGVEPVITATTRIPEKATEKLVEQIVAGVTIHRGSSAVAAINDTPPATESADAAPRKATVEQHGVTIHRGRLPDATGDHEVTVHVMRGG